MLMLQIAAIYTAVDMHKNVSEKKQVSTST